MEELWHLTEQLIETMYQQQGNMFHLSVKPPQYKRPDERQRAGRPDQGRLPTMGLSWASDAGTTNGTIVIPGRFRDWSQRSQAALEPTESQLAWCRLPHTVERLHCLLIEERWNTPPPWLLSVTGCLMKEIHFEPRRYESAGCNYHDVALW